MKSEEFISIVENASKWKHDINYKVKPLFYEVTEDFGGMYVCEPYKTDLLKAWKFSNKNASDSSADKIKGMFLSYLKEDDFVGADLAKKFLRAGSERKPIDKECQSCFLERYLEIKENQDYLKLRSQFLLKQKIQRERNERR
tara:strand:+ start:1076 stop:1501 length:426 start_codon:yes stop_codon:yes gene_type:complete